jgi:hypothetical protein
LLPVPLDLAEADDERHRMTLHIVGLALGGDELLVVRELLIVHVFLQRSCSANDEGDGAGVQGPEDCQVVAWATLRRPGIGLWPQTLKSADQHIGRAALRALERRAVDVRIPRSTPMTSIASGSAARTVSCRAAA